mgnify:CR=1 FL=1
MYQAPDAKGHFGIFGGRYVIETLLPALKELEREYHTAINDPAFLEEFHYYLNEYVGRPTSLFYAEELTKKTAVVEVGLGPIGEAAKNRRITPIDNVDQFGGRVRGFWENPEIKSGISVPISAAAGPVEPCV